MRRSGQVISAAVPFPRAWLGPVCASRAHRKLPSLGAILANRVGEIVKTQRSTWHTLDVALQCEASVLSVSVNVRSGVPGLDDILSGGFSKGALFLIEGNPGTGKTTLALRFALEGAAAGERTLYITLSETKQELQNGAASHGWSIGPEIEVFELQPPESLFSGDQEQSLLYSSDLELGETVKLIFDAVDRTRPDRIVLDSLSEIRLLAQSSLRYRRQLLAIKHYFARRDATVLALDDLTTEALDKTAHSIAHGVIRLEELTPNYGGERRRLRVIKYRGQAFRSGYHDFIIRTGGLEVFPRLISKEHLAKLPIRISSSGNSELDALLGGGIESGSSTLVLGPAGCGKSLLVFQFAADRCRLPVGTYADGRSHPGRLKRTSSHPLTGDRPWLKSQRR